MASYSPSLSSSSSYNNNSSYLPRGMMLFQTQQDKKKKIFQAYFQADNQVILDTHTL